MQSMGKGLPCFSDRAAVLTQPSWSATHPLQLFPYHLGEYVCRQLRMSPFK